MMETGIYVSLSSQLAAERRLATIADNVANVNTTGFREAQVRFGELLGRNTNARISFVEPAEGFLSATQGALNQTGNDLDFAISGEGWFLVDTPSGQAVTRDGRYTINPEGTLTTLDGYPVMDQGGSPIQISRAAGPVTSDASGILYQNNSIIGSIGVFDAPDPGETRRIGSLSILPEGSAIAAVDRSDFSVQQGFVEQSNVNAIKQITTMITVQRNFEETSSLMQQSEQSLSELVRLLGGK
jgi:flagellar basal-body rod protein FlgF